MGRDDGKARRDPGPRPIGRAKDNPLRGTVVRSYCSPFLRHVMNLFDRGALQMPNKELAVSPLPARGVPVLGTRGEVVE